MGLGFDCAQPAISAGIKQRWVVALKQLKVTEFVVPRLQPRAERSRSPASACPQVAHVKKQALELREHKALQDLFQPYSLDRNRKAR